MAPLVHVLYQFGEGVQPSIDAEYMFSVNSPISQPGIRKDPTLAQIAKVNELANHGVCKPAVFYSVRVQPFVQITEIVQELPIHTPFSRDGGSHLRPYPARIQVSLLPPR